MKTRAERVPKM